MFNLNKDNIRCGAILTTYPHSKRNDATEVISVKINVNKFEFRLVDKPSFMK